MPRCMATITMAAIAKVAMLLACVMCCMALVVAAAAASGAGAAAASSSASLSASVMKLDGADWKVVNSNGSVSVPATVPGNIYTDLMDAGVLGDPLYGYNEHTYRWVTYDPYWTYTKVFTPSTDLFSYNTVEIVFYGLDTIANVSLNGVPLGSTTNMFRRYTFDVTATLLANAENTLTVVLQSPSAWAGAYAASYPYTVITTDPDGEIPYRNYIRKGQSDFGWDWGPGLAPSGIWKTVELRAFNEILINELTFLTTPVSQLTADQRVLYGLDRSPATADSTSFAVNVTAFLRVSPRATNGVASGLLSVSVANATANSGSITLPACASCGTDFSYAISVLLVVQSPQLWWPIGYGDPNLYSLVATFKGAQGEVSTSTRTVGFRVIEIVREPIPNLPGLSFYFRVNGVAVYAKGSNMVPFNVFHTRANETYITRLVQSAIFANQNIIRVWGGGVYQTDFFYDLADRSGLLVWQEFAFACAMYPISDWFLDSVRVEVTQQLRRLQSHASIAVFGGNNENEAAISWFSNTETDRDFHLINYNELYVNVVRDVMMREVALHTEFVVSSPSNGPLTMVPFTQRWGDVGDLNYGDVHTYNYVDDCSNPDIYPRARFVSEFGFQSEPSFATYAAVSTPADWSYNSDWMQFRQHHAGGNDQMMSQLQRHFNTPNSTDSVAQYTMTLYLTQAVQTICYKTALEFWRRIQNEEGHTQGVIYWQLNDVWQAPTWSSIEYGGRFKMVHYGIKESFAPLLVSGYVNQTTNNLTVYVINDNQQSVTGLVVLELYDWTAGLMRQTMSFDFTVGAGTAVYINEVPVASLTGNGVCTDSAQCFVRLRMVSSCVTCSESIVYLGPLANANLPEPNITVVQVVPTSAASATAAATSSEVQAQEVVSEARSDEHTFATMAVKDEGSSSPSSSSSMVTSVTISLNSSAPAAYVWLEAPISGYFSTNGFVMLPNLLVDVVFTAYEPFDPTAFSVSAISIRGTY